METAESDELFDCGTRGAGALPSGRGEKGIQADAAGLSGVCRVVALLLTAISGAGQVLAAEPDAIARGEYLAAAAGCDTCHTDSEHGGAPYAGGRRLATAYGTVTTPNITPDRATGIGKWTRADFARALRSGVAPDDSHYLPVFPFAYYNRLSDRDLSDLKALLGSVPAVARPDLAPTAGPAVIERARAALAGAATPPGGRWQPDPARDAAWNRGAYLVATIGRCGECHTPRTALGAPDPGRFLAGTPAGGGVKKTPNITPDQETGIGKWSEDEIVTLLKEGQTPEFDFVGGSMAEIVKNTARLSNDDRRAIAIYLRNLPAKSFPGGS